MDGQSQAFIGAAMGAAASQPQAAATDAMVQGMDALRTAAAKLGAVNPKISQGNLFEYIEAAKFNADAALKQSGLRAEVTAAMGEPHAAADLLIKEGDRTLHQVQAKSMNCGSRTTHAISQPKYRGMQKLVPANEAERVKGLAQKRASSGTLKADDYRDTAKNVTGELKAKQARSGGTTYHENLKAAQQPKLYAVAQELRYVGKEVLVTGGQAAIAGGIIAGGVSAVKNGIALNNGEISIQTAAGNVVQDSGKAATRSGATGAAGSVIRYGASKVGINALAKSNVAVTVAAGGIDVGLSVLRYAKGEITAEELQHQVGMTGTCTLSSLYAGAAIGSVAGPVGAVVGSLGGYLVGSYLYQASTSIVEQAQLAEAEAERVMAIAQVAVQAMQQERSRFTAEFQVAFEAKAQQYEACFAAIEAGLTARAPAEAVVGLSTLASSFGQQLRFSSFEEFDTFMGDANATLVL